ncbi:GNVR domain-containing protein [Caulobacter sp. 17J80-11]|uniref:GumC family protein n=1 Tax=Caulobacter sp. 17J80-11 TaxID=2763502 RepID=UPI001653CAA5|nr:GNVR domain-containing protein [Caulobacter sp. 17J80-11]MBC6983543.1 AAA family ATPase [Caulobacter sp. 17J80-11]
MNLFRSNPQDLQGSDPRPYGGVPDPRDLMARFRRRLPLFGLVAGTVFLAAVLVTLRATPQYTATASVLIDPRKQAVLKLDQVISQLPTDSSVVDTEARIINSRAVGERVVRRLRLDQDPDFASKPSGKAIQASLAGGAGAAAPEGAVDAVLSQMWASRVGLTYVIDVGFTSTDPKKAARIANAFAEEYINQQLAAKAGANDKASGWLKAKLDEMRRQAEAADAEVQTYKINHGLLSAEGATMAEQEISVLNQQIAEAQADQAEKEGRLAAARAQVRRGGGGADTAAALGSDVIRQLRGQRAEVSRHKAELESRYGPRHPDVQKVNQELADYDVQIDAEIKRVLSNLEAEVQVARQRTSSLVGSRGTSRGNLANNNRAQVGLMELERKAMATRAIYEAFLNRSKETAAQAGIQQADARVVSYAQTPSRPSAPNTRLNLALGLAFALAAGMASVVTAEALDSGLRTGKEVRNRLGLPMLGAVPVLGSVAAAADRGSLKPEDYLLKRPRSAFAESFRSLKTSLLSSRGEDLVQVVAVTSALPEEGKTLTTFCLGRLAAAAGQKVVVVDCDLRHRSLTQKLEGGVRKGLFELLAGKASLDEVLRLDKASGAQVLPIAEGSWSDPEIFRSPAMQKLLAELRHRFDLVLLDTPPILAVSDTRVLATRADAVLYLLRWAKTPEMAAKNALEQLAASGAFVPGVALTQVDLREQARTGYGDAAYYYGSVQKYYAD